MPRYSIVQPVEHDHVRHEFGEINLPLASAEPLLAVGAIAEAPKEKTKRGTKRKTADGIEGDPDGADDQDDDDDDDLADTDPPLFDDEHTDVP